MILLQRENVKIWENNFGEKGSLEYIISFVNSHENKNLNGFTTWYVKSYS